MDGRICILKMKKEPQSIWREQWCTVIFLSFNTEILALGCILTTMNIPPIWRTFVRIICVKNYATLLRNNSLVLCCRKTLINVPFLFLKKHNTFSFLFMAEKQVITVSEKTRESSIIYLSPPQYWAALCSEERPSPCKNRKGGCLVDGILAQWEQFLQHCLALCRSARNITI